MLFAASRTQLTQPGDHSVWEGVWVENSEKLRHFLWYRNSFSAEINFFHGFAGTGFLEGISLAIPAEKTKKLITKIK